MSLIEGIGDEVTLFATVLVIVTTLIAAWFSTRVRDRPLPQVRVIQTTITSIREGQRIRSNVSIRNEQSREGGGGGGGVEEETSHLSASEVSQETSSERTPESDNAESSQVTQNVVASDHHIGAQSEEVPLSRTSESSDNVESKKKNSDKTDSKEVQSEECISEDREQIDIEVLGETIEETSSSSPGGSSSTHVEAEVQGASQNLDQNVLRNRQTGQTYPTLPAFSSEASQGATPSSRVTGGDGQGVEDIGSGHHGDEDSGQTAEGSICIRVKFSNDEERLVQTTPEETLGQFRRQNFVEEIEAGKLVRFIANGQFLADDTQTLSSLNLTNNSVLHCHVTQGDTIRQAQHRAQDGDLDLGHFMVPLFGCILGFVWYLRWQYRYMFNATSTLSLVGVTVLFVLAVLAAWRG